MSNKTNVLQSTDFQGTSSILVEIHAQNLRGEARKTTEIQINVSYRYCTYINNRKFTPI